MKPWVHHDSLATQGYSLIRISLCYPTLIWNVATEPTAIIIGVTQNQSMKVSVAMPNLSLFFSMYVCVCVFAASSLWSLILFILAVFSQQASGIPLGIRKGKGCQFPVWVPEKLITADMKSLRYLMMIQSLCDLRPPPPICLHKKGLVADQMLWQHPWVSLRHRDS